MPFTGPAAAYATIGHKIAAYFKKINAEGGLNGRKLNLIASDDSYNPATTLQQARRLVEDEQVLLIFAGRRMHSRLYECQEGAPAVRRLGCIDVG
jgi:branched-chain amino acid transport system substrate-binding protein